MFPASAAALALEFVTCCVNVAKVIKKTIEAMKKARQTLLDVIHRVERMRTILELLRSLAVQLEGSGQQDWFINLQEAECRRTMQALYETADEIAKVRMSWKFLGSAKFAYDEKKIDGLLKDLSSQETELTHVVSLISAKMTAEMSRNVRNLVDSQRNFISSAVSIDGITLVGSEEPSLGPGSNKDDGLKVGTWLMPTVTDYYDSEYLVKRRQLSDAAYFGNWNDFWILIEIGKTTYGESWINATRLKPSQQAHEMSLWTPLHQAVYHFAPTEVVQRMIDEGAFRTFRCRYTDPAEFPYRDMTPLELAQDLGFVHLYDILCPVLRYQLPGQVLQNLEQRFHDLISNDLGGRLHDEQLNLPSLSMLTELKVPQLWCPVRINGRPKAGYFFQLDGREMVVRSFCINEDHVVKSYRITETDMFEIGDDPVMPNVYVV